MDKTDGRVISNFINQALKNMDITIYGDGSQTRSFCYITDQINGLVKLMNSNYCKPVNIGNPDELTIKEAKLIKKSLEKNLFRYDASEQMERRIGSDSLWYAMTKYIRLTSKYINEITEELDFSY